MIRSLFAALGAIALTAAAANAWEKREPQTKMSVAEKSAETTTLSKCEMQRLSDPRESKCERVKRDSLARDELAVLDEALRLSRAGDETADTSCHYSIISGIVSWSCVGGGWFCTCVNANAGPTCVCTEV